MVRTVGLVGALPSNETALIYILTLATETFSREVIPLAKKLQECKVFGVSRYDSKLTCNPILFAFVCSLLHAFDPDEVTNI